MKMCCSTFVNVSSTNRNSTIFPSSNIFEVQLPIPLNYITCVELISVTLPNTIYKIQNFNNNLFWLSTANFNIQIPLGSYTIFSLITFIQTAMNSADPGNNYQLTYNSSTLKLHFLVAILYSYYFHLQTLVSRN